MAKHTRFAKTVQVFFVASLSEMSPSEIDASFCSEDDTQRYQSDAARAVRSMRRGKREEDDEETCFRGLEHFRSAARLEQRKINRDCVTEAVLCAQDEQQKMNEDEIAAASEAASKWARDLALMYGASDEAYVFRTTMEEMILRHTKNEASGAGRRGLALKKTLDLLMKGLSSSGCDSQASVGSPITSNPASAGKPSMSSAANQLIRIFRTSNPSAVLRASQLNDSLEVQKTHLPTRDAMVRLFSQGGEE